MSAIIGPSRSWEGNLTYGVYASSRRQKTAHDKFWFLGDTDLVPALYDWWTQPERSALQQSFSNLHGP